MVEVVSSKKYCKGCEREKDLSEFGTDRKMKLGKKAFCKHCTSILRREHYQRNREKSLEVNCTYAERNYEQIQRQRKQYRETNQEKIAERNKKYREENHVEIAERGLQYREENKDAIAKQRHRYKLRNPDSLRESKRRWYRQNRDAYAQYRQNRRAKEKSAPGSFTLSELKAVYMTQEYRCAYCQSEDPLSIDHIVPLSRGGSNWITNIQGLCLTCNLKKGSKLESELFTRKSNEENDIKPRLRSR